MTAFAPFLAAGIFLLMFVLIILDHWPHHYITLACGLAVLVVVFGLLMHSQEAIWRTLNLSAFLHPSFWIATGAEEAADGINWSTILFIAGMMVMVEGMSEAGVFRWLCLQLARLVDYQASRIFVVFMILSAILAMFIDSITVILFLAAVTVELARVLKFDPIPMILAEIFCANLGGSATMCGDPPNIIIGTSLHYTFKDFIMNTGLIAGLSLVAVVIYFWFCFHKEYKEAEKQPLDMKNMVAPEDVITSRTGFITSIMIFLCAIVLLITHAQTGLTVAFIGAFIALVTLIAFYRKAPALLRRVDWETLLFFIGLFVVVSGLEETGVLEVIAVFIADVCGGNIYLVIAIILWVSAVASAFVDNIPFAATMIPIIQSLARSMNIPLATLAWTLSMGTDIGGSATPIGASANVVGTAVAMKNGYPVGWGRYCKYCVPATVLVLMISMAVIMLRYVVL